MVIKINNGHVYGLENSIKCIKYSFDPKYNISTDEDNEVSEKQIKIAKTCGTAPNGSGHDCFLKGIIVQFDLEAPHYLLLQLMRYHWIDFVMSTSKMHSLTKMDLDDVCTPEVFKETKELLKTYIDKYNLEEDKDKKKNIWRSILANCPLGLMLRARLTTNYMQLKTIYKQRKNHKLTEWHTFCEWCESLPKFKELVLDE